MRPVGCLRPGDIQVFLGRCASLTKGVTVDGKWGLRVTIVGYEAAVGESASIASSLFN